MDSQRIVTDEIYHVYSKSIAEYVIFNNDFEYSRMREVIEYYRIERPFVRFSRFKERNMQVKQLDVKRLVQIICYCIMPTHIHLVLKQLKDKGISVFMSNVLNSYSRYFNIKHNRKGPLWESSFKKVLVESDAQLLHLTRYIHLNPATAYIVNNPEDWKWSSYREYISGNKEGICEYDNVLDIKPEEYKKFVEDRISYQRELAKIKDMILE
ncbi:MAG: transposase [Candidatus Omnitrophica bacterium]|nr:transposase [Candidatus Omnitrophota bacterium]